MWFYAFDCLDCFWVMNEYFLDFVIFGVSLVLPLCMGFYSLGGLEVSYEVDFDCGKL